MGAYSRRTARALQGARRRPRRRVRPFDVPPVGNIHFASRRWGVTKLCQPPGSDRSTAGHHVLSVRFRFPVGCPAPPGAERAVLFVTQSHTERRERPKGALRIVVGEGPNREWVFFFAGLRPAPRHAPHRIHLAAIGEPATHGAKRMPLPPRYATSPRSFPACRDCRSTVAGPPAMTSGSEKSPRIPKEYGKKDQPTAVPLSLEG